MATTDLKRMLFRMDLDYRFWRLGALFHEYSAFNAPPEFRKKLDELAMWSAQTYQEGVGKALPGGRMPLIEVVWPGSRAGVKKWCETWDSIVEQLHDAKTTTTLDLLDNGIRVARPYQPEWRENAVKSAEVCEWLNRLLRRTVWLPSEMEDDPRFADAVRIGHDSLGKIARAVEELVEKFGRDAVDTQLKESLTHFSQLRYPHLIESGELSIPERILWLCAIRDGYRRSDFLCPWLSDQFDLADDCSLLPLDQFRFHTLAWEKIHRLLESDADRMLRYVDDFQTVLAATVQEAGRKRRQRKKGNAGGRPKKYNAMKDQQIWHAWQSGSYKYLNDLASSLGITVKEVTRAMDRNRKRRKSSSGKTPVNSQ